MGKFAKIAAGLNVVAVICVLVALIVNILSYYDGNGVEATYGATEYSIEYTSSLG